MGEMKPESIIRAILAEKRISQMKLAEILDKSVQVVSSKMTGRTKFTFEEIKLICKELDVDPNIFFT